MTILFEPSSTVLQSHEKVVREILDDVTPPEFVGTLVLAHYWRDDPVRVTLRRDGVPPVVSWIEINDLNEMDGERHLREALMRLFEAPAS